MMRRAVGAAAVYAAVTVVLLWPLWSRFVRPSRTTPATPYVNTWILWHGSQTVPLSQAWWNGPMFFPMKNSLALSEVLLSLLPISSVVQAITGNPVAASNAAFALSFPLSGVAVYLVTRELTGRHDAAVVGGLAYGFGPVPGGATVAPAGPVRNHSAPLVFLGLHRYEKDRNWKWLVLFGGAWLAQILANGYALFELSVLVALWIVWFLRPLRSALPVLAAWLVASLPMVPILLEYSEVHSALHLVRTINEIKRFGVGLAHLLAASPPLAVWGGRLGAARPETAAFPGLTLIVLAIVARAAERRVRAGQAARQGGWQRACVTVSAVAALVAMSVYVVGPWALGPLTVSGFQKPFSIAVAARLGAFLGSSWTRRMWADRSAAGFYLLAMAAMSYTRARTRTAPVWQTGAVRTSICLVHAPAGFRRDACSSQVPDARRAASVLPDCPRNRALGNRVASDGDCRAHLCWHRG